MSRLRMERRATSPSHMAAANAARPPALSVCVFQPGALTVTSHSSPTPTCCLCQRSQVTSHVILNHLSIYLCVCFLLLFGFPALSGFRVASYPIKYGIVPYMATYGGVPYLKSLEVGNTFCISLFYLFFMSHSVHSCIHPSPPPTTPPPSPLLWPFLF